MILSTPYSLATHVAAKLEEGDYRAVCLASSEDSFTDLDEDTMATLKLMHPSLHPETQIPPPLLRMTPPPSLPSRKMKLPRPFFLSRMAQLVVLTASALNI